MTDADIEAIHSRMEYVHFSNDQIVFKQGDYADKYFIVINGEVTLSQTNNKYTKLVERIKSHH